MNRITKNLINKHPDFPVPGGILTEQNGVFAKCPKCNLITSIRVCYGCKELMCQECLTEHQVRCLKK